MKDDPKYIAAARELRDRYLEQVNRGRLRKRVTMKTKKPKGALIKQLKLTSAR